MKAIWIMTISPILNVTSNNGENKGHIMVSHQNYSYKFKMHLLVLSSVGHLQISCILTSVCMLVSLSEIHSDVSICTLKFKCIKICINSEYYYDNLGGGDGGGGC
jgi:hypothetical protein